MNGWTDFLSQENVWQQAEKLAKGCKGKGKMSGGNTRASPAAFAPQHKASKQKDKSVPCTPHTAFYQVLQ